MPRKIRAVVFEWDKGNITKSWIKHGISKEECEEAFLNRPLKIFEDDKHSLVEERFVAYGHTSSNKPLIMIFTLRNNKVRIISARKQNKKENNIYENK
jgi:uncharacterized DUF497 family protein